MCGSEADISCVLMLLTSYRVAEEEKTTGVHNLNTLILLHLPHYSVAETDDVW